MIMWLSVELAGRAKIWGSHPYFRYWTSFFSKTHASKTNNSLYFAWKRSEMRFLRHFMGIWLLGGGMWGIMRVSVKCLYLTIKFYLDTPI